MAGEQQCSRPALWASLTLISGLWGSSFLFVKLIDPSVPPFAFAALRGFIAMASLAAWIGCRRLLSDGGTPLRPQFGWRTFRHVAVLGTTNGWLASALTVIAVRHIASSMVAMIQAAVPLIVALLAHGIFPEERFRPGQAIGILIGVAGILLIAGPVAVWGAAGSSIGIAAILLTALCLAVGTVYGRHVKAADATMLACGQQAFGAVVACVISCSIEPPALWSQPLSSWLLFVPLGILCSAAPTALYLRLLARTPSTPSALVTYLQPVWATLLGWGVLAEQPGPAALAGVGLVIAGIALTTAPPFQTAAIVSQKV